MQITRSRSMEIVAVADALRSCAPGETATYQTLDHALGADCRVSRHIVMAARDRLHDEGFVFEAVPNVGYRRLTQEEIAATVPTRRAYRIRGQARRGLKELSAIERPDALGPAERARYYAGAALMSAIAAVATNRGLKKIGQLATESASLPLDATLDALKGIK